MAEHAHTTPTTTARRRHIRAAPGALDRRCGRLLRQPATAAQRARIERDLELLIELLNLLDGDTDSEAEQEGSCEAGDDDPATSRLHLPGCGTLWGTGDPADGEITPEDEGEPSDAHDYMGDRLNTVMGGVPL